VARTLSAQCEYQGAVDWAEMGLQVHQRHSLGSNKLRLYLLNEWGLARVLLGQTLGLEADLRRELEGLGEGPGHTLLTSTLADVLLMQGRPAEAAALYRRLWEQAPKRNQYGLIANLWMRSLLELDDHEAALQLAARAVNRTSDLPPLVHNRALLAQGMALALINPTKAVQLLKTLLETEPSATGLLRRTQAALYLALAHLEQGQEAKARAALEPFSSVIERLGRGGLRYLAGPEAAFGKLWKLFQTPSKAPLQLRFLGGVEVLLEGQPLSLRQRHAEILVALALNPKGLSGDALTLRVYGEAGSLATTKADFSRLREIIPLGSRPYRLLVEVSADFLELPRRLSVGKLREAVALYQGQLLPNSDAPVVAEEREVLEEAIRRATLESGDPEALLTLAERFKNDLGLWEAALAALPKSDPRRVMAQLRANKVDQDWGE
jgi:tetratricopeptide (TPR) repeat protein